MILLSSFALRLYYKKGRLNIGELFVWSVLDIYLFVKTESRLSFALTFVLILYCIFLKFIHYIKLDCPKLKNIGTSCMTFSFIVYFAVSFFVIFGNSSKSDFIVSLFGTRIDLSLAAVAQYGVHLFPRSIEWIGNGLDLSGNISTLAYNYVDCFYLNLLLTYGVLITIAVIFALTMACRYALKIRDYNFVFIMFVFSIHCMVDDLFMRLYFNVFWLAVIKYIISYVSLIRYKNGLTNNTKKINC